MSGQWEGDYEGLCTTKHCLGSSRILFPAELKSTASDQKLGPLATLQCHCLPYFFGYKTEFYSFLNSPKNLDLSCKTDLDLCDCLGRVKLIFYQNFIGLIESFVVILERGNPRLIAE